MVGVRKQDSLNVTIIMIFIITELRTEQKK